MHKRCRKINRIFIRREYLALIVQNYIVISDRFGKTVYSYFMISATSMQHIMKTIQTTLRRKSYDRTMLWRLLLNQLQGYIHSPMNLSWYLKRHTLYVEISDHALRIQLFTHKTDYLTQLNTWLRSEWYTMVIRDIRTLASLHDE